MNIHPLTDIQIDRGTATNQLLVWNDTTKRFEVTLNPVAPPSGTFGHWDRTGTVLSPANPGDSVKADALHIDNTTGPDAVITMDGTGGNTGVFAYESDTDLFTFDKDVTVNATMDATAYRNIKISGDTPPEVSLETTGTVLGTDLIGCFDWFGNGSGVNQSVAGIEVKANENWSSTEAGTKMLFYATEKNSLNKSYLMALEQISSTAAGVGFGDFSTKAILSEMHLYLNTTGTLNTGIKLEQDGTGDAKLAFILTGSQEYDFGIDNSDGDRLKLSRGTRVSTDTMMQWDTSGNANILGNVRIGDTTTPTYALEVAGVTKTESGRIVKTTRLTADGTTLSTAHHEVFCDTDGGAFTVTLPATPVGQTYRITNSGSNNLTVGRNGNNIKGSATDAIIPSGDTLILTWEPTEGWW